MLAAIVASNFERFDLGFGGCGHSTNLDDNHSQLIDATSPAYQQLMLSEAPRYVTMASTNYQQAQQQQQQQQRQSQRPAITISGQQPLYANQQLDGSEMSYLGQTLIPSGYPIPQQQGQQRAVYQPSPSSGYNTIGFDNRQLQAWPQHQHSTSPAGDVSQRQFFEEYQQHQALQAGSRSSLSSSRASMDMSVQQHNHIVYNQISPTQQSPNSEYMLGLQPQHHHHHSMPTQSPNAHTSDYNSESSSREREPGGAPNMVGLEGMPEPAPRPKGPKLKFTRADDALLVELKEGKNLTWKQIADFFPGRSSGTLQVRYCTKLKAKTTVWTDEMVSTT